MNLETLYFSRENECDNLMEVLLAWKVKLLTDG